MGRRNPTLLEYFLQRVEFKETDECLIWKGTIASNGYPRVAHGGNRNLQGHRISFQLFKGQIPPGMMVCHTCDTPLCVNPRHLYRGTQKQNMRDRLERKRIGDTQRRVDKKTRAAILLAARRGVSIKRLAEKHGVTAATIMRIKRACG